MDLGQGKEGVEMKKADTTIHEGHMRVGGTKEPSGMPRPPVTPTSIPRVKERMSELSERISRYLEVYRKRVLIEERKDELLRECMSWVPGSLRDEIEEALEE